MTKKTLIIQFIPPFVFNGGKDIQLIDQSIHNNKDIFSYVDYHN